MAVGNVALECFGACGDEIGIELAPHGKQRRLGGAEVLLEFRIKLHVVGIVEEEVELDVDVAGQREDGSVECIPGGSMSEGSGMPTPYSCFMPSRVSAGRIMLRCSSVGSRQ